jgi:hypothetical protein
MKRNLYIIATVLVMLGVSRMAVRIIDATVGIDNDIAVLLVFLVIMNLLIAWISRKLYEIICIRVERK